MPHVTVIIPNWNGARFLPTCLEALRCQSYRDFEVLVVDNASSDGSRELLRGYPEVQLIPLPKNAFFAEAVNEGIRRAQGEILVLLNNDTEAEPLWLEELVRALEEHPQAGMATSKILLFHRRHVLHSAGDLYRRDGIPTNRGVWEHDQGQYDTETQVFGACAAAAAYRRQMLEEIGLLDEDFSAYCEDVDLSFRAQLAGYHCVFAPKARVYHHLSATGSGPLASYLCARNIISLIVKDMPTPLLRRHWPRILSAQLGYLLHSLRHFREPAARAWFRGQMAALGCLPRMLKKRRQVQSMRKVSYDYLESILQP